MLSPEIDEFAKIIIQQVRDIAIRNCKVQLEPHVMSPVAKRWREAVGADAAENALAVAIPDCVDETVFCLLQAIDQGIMQLSYTAASGNTVNLSAEGLGELSGWYMGSSGWRAKYTKEDYVDDFSDLA